MRISSRFSFARFYSTMKFDTANNISTSQSKARFPMSQFPTISIYRPSRRAGRVLYSMMGENFIWEVSSSSLNIDDYLPTSLSIVSPKTLHDYLKHHTRLGRRFCRTVRRIQVRNEKEVFSDDEDGKILIEEILKDGIYNFILMSDGRLIFTRIPEQRRKYNYRMLGKHATLSQHSSGVRFAGEMRIIDDQRTLMINNDSGTYQPTTEMIEGAMLFLHDLFPYLNVIGIERQKRQK